MTFSINFFRFRIHFLLITFIIICNCGIFCSISNASDILTEKERTWLQKNEGKIRLGPDPNAPPLDFFNEKGEYKGLTADYVRLIEKKLGCQFEIVRMESWDSLLQAAYEKKIDIICAAKRTPEREKHLLFTKPFISVPEIIVTSKVTQKSLTIEELKGLEVTMVEGYAVYELVKNRHCT